MYVIKNNYNAACNFFATFDLKSKVALGEKLNNVQLTDEIRAMK